MNQQEHTEFENKVLAQFMSGKSVFGNKKYGKEVYPPAKLVFNRSAIMY